jgi:transcriptional regulator GlxA family with amidase domain
MDSHYHPFCELIAILKGRLHVVLGNEPIVVREGEVIFYKAFVSHKEWSDPDDPAESLFLGFYQKDSDEQLPLHTHDSSGRIRQLLNWFYQDRDAVLSDRNHLNALMLDLVLIEFQRTLNHPQHQLVYMIREYMRQHIEESLDLQSLADQSGVSKYHLVRRYKILTGRTPMEDLRWMRIEHARNLILTSNLPLKVIAEKAGLADEYHLSHLFRRYLGFPPGELRRETFVSTVD